MYKWCFLLLLPFVSVGQKSSYWEGHAGFLTSQMTGDGFGGFRKLGLEAGIGVTKSIRNSKSCFAFQLNYIQKGAGSRIYDDVGNTYNYSLDMDYIEVPVSYLFPIFGVYAELGITASYNIRYRYVNNGISYSEPANLRFMEWGFLGGVNFQVGQKMVFGVKYMNSLTPIQSTTTSFWYLFRQGGLHQAFALKLQYYFDSSYFIFSKNPKPKKEEDEEDI